METKKIALACFVGGVICGAVALLLSPAIWWLGMLAGFVGGYVSYEFRDFCTAVPTALRKTVQVVGSGGSYILGELCHEIFRKPHPFARLGMFAGAIFWTVMLLIGKIDIGQGQKLFSQNPPAAVCSWFLAWVVAGMIIELVLISLPFAVKVLNDPGAMRYSLDPRYVYADRPLLTVSLCLQYALQGYWKILLFFVWYLWKGLATGILFVIRFASLFLWTLFKLIHSEKRVLCGVDGALGGVASYIWFGAIAHPILVVIFGGLLGAGFGILNWEIVSKRILKVERV